MSVFAGFDRAAVALLADAPTWSPDDRARYDRTLRAGLREPAAALIAAVADGLAADLTVTARSSVSPLHTDRRFAPADAPRYKDHVLMTTWEGPAKSSSPILWIRLDATRVGFASGIAFTPPIRDRWREAVAGTAGEQLAAVLEDLDGRVEVAAEQLARVPRPHAEDHPRANLLRAKGFQVRSIEPLPAVVSDAAFVPWCIERLEALLPVHRWLVDHVART